MMKIARNNKCNWCGKYIKPNEYVVLDDFKFFHPDCYKQLKESGQYA